MFAINKNQDQDQKSPQQSYFYKLYQQKIKEIKEANSSIALDIQDQSLIQILNENSGQDDYFEYDQSESIQTSDYTNLVARTLNLPYSQVYLQASTNPSGFEKLLEKAKRQIRRMKAKDRQKKKSDKDYQIRYNNQDQSSDLKTKHGVTSSCHQTSSGEEITKKQKISNPETDIIDEDPTQRQIQMIRNRMSAQNSRDRKKQYINKLESDARKLEQQNIFLQSQLDQQSSQLVQIQNSNIELQNQLQNISQQYQSAPLDSLICADCQSKKIVYDCEYYGDNIIYIQDSQPSLSKKRSANLSKLGLAFLATVTIMAIIASPPSYSDLKKNLSQKTSLQIWKGKSETKEINGIKYYDRVVSQGDSQYDVLNKISQFPYTDHKKLEEVQDESLIRRRIRQNRKQFKNQLATLDYFKDDRSVSTVYCPNSFKYQDFSQNGLEANFQQNQWIHLLVPVNNMTLFYVANKVMMTRERAQQNNVLQMSEIWCQVKSVNELYIQ